MSLNRFFRQEELRWILPKSPWEDWDDYDEELALMVESEEKHVIEVECRPYPEVDPDIEKI